MQQAEIVSDLMRGGALAGTEAVVIIDHETVDIATHHAPCRQVGITNGHSAAGGTAGDIAYPNVQVAIRVPGTDAFGRRLHIVRFGVRVEPGLRCLRARDPGGGVPIGIYGG